MREQRGQLDGEQLHRSIWLSDMKNAVPRHGGCANVHGVNIYLSRPVL